MFVSKKHSTESGVCNLNMHGLFVSLQIEINNKISVTSFKAEHISDHSTYECLFQISSGMQWLQRPVGKTVSLPITNKIVYIGDKTINHSTLPHIV